MEWRRRLRQEYLQLQSLEGPLEGNKSCLRTRPRHRRGRADVWSPSLASEAAGLERVKVRSFWRPLCTLALYHTLETQRLCTLVLYRALGTQQTDGTSTASG